MKFFSDRLKDSWNRVKHFCIHNILHADDPPHTLALGIAVGMFVALLPMIGIQMLLAFAFAWMVRANKAVAVSLVWISNPLTMVPIYYPGYWLGCRMLNMPTRGRWIELIRSDATGTAKFKALLDDLQDIALPMFLGTFIVAAVFGLISYYLSLWVIRTYRLRRWGQLMPPRLTPVSTGSDDFPDDNLNQPGTKEHAA